MVILSLPLLVSLGIEKVYAASFILVLVLEFLRSIRIKLKSKNFKRLSPDVWKIVQILAYIMSWLSTVIVICLFQGMDPYTHPRGGSKFSLSPQEPPWIQKEVSWITQDHHSQKLWWSKWVWADQTPSASRICVAYISLTYEWIIADKGARLVTKLEGTHNLHMLGPCCLGHDYHALWGL